MLKKNISIQILELKEREKKKKKLVKGLIIALLTALGICVKHDAKICLTSITNTK